MFSDRFVTGEPITKRSIRLIVFSVMGLMVSIGIYVASGYVGDSGTDVWDQLKKKVVGAPRWRYEAYIGGPRPMVMINGQALALGQTIEGHALKDFDRLHATLQRQDGSTMELPFTGGNDKTKVRSKGKPTHHTNTPQAADRRPAAGGPNIVDLLQSGDLSNISKLITDSASNGSLNLTELQSGNLSQLVETLAGSTNDDVKRPGAKY